MPETSIQPAASSGGALSAEHYQTFEMAKANDDVIGGSNIAQIRSYAAYARAQAQAIHKTIAATSGIEDVAAIKAEATETAQTFAKVGIYADQRIGEILRELPTSTSFHGNQHRQVDSDAQEPTKASALQDAGISRSQAYDLQAMAANPDVVQAVLDKAEADGTIPSRSQVLKAIQERDMARKVADKLKAERDDARDEIAALEKQNDELYDRANAEQQPQVIERVVESDAAKKRIRDLEHERDLYLSDVQKLRRRNEDMRKELDKAKVLIGEKQRNDSAEWDIAALTAATNNYLRQYGGKAWAFDQFYRVDEVTRAEFVKAINNLAAFAQNLAQMIKEQTSE
jgi:hypothetical protein